MLGDGARSDFFFAIGGLAISKALSELKARRARRFFGLPGERQILAWLFFVEFGNQLLH